MDRTVVITGGSAGIGLAAAEQFTALGDRVVLIGRNPQRLAGAVERVTRAGRAPDHFQADFEDLSQVRDLAGRLRAAYPRIDVLANNAGGMVSGFRLTGDGFEATIQSNHLAPFLLTNLLRDNLHGARVVTTASRAHHDGRPDPDDFAADAGFGHRYGAAKAANVLFAAELARRWPDVTSVSFHPGVVRSNFGTGRLVRLFYRYAPFLVTPEKAGALLVWLATEPAERLVDGGYYVGHEPRTPAAHAVEATAAGRLWDASTAAVGINGDGPHGGG
jgi:NAD(P)-dependent dehydrogenase (short-subunit alcohol dehydrogenase family)